MSIFKLYANIRKVFEQAKEKKLYNIKKIIKKYEL